MGDDVTTWLPPDRMWGLNGLISSGLCRSASVSQYSHSQEACKSAQALCNRGLQSSRQPRCELWTSLALRK